MKKFATILLMVLFGISVYAETEIPLIEKDKKSGGNGIKNNRSEIVMPCASIEDGVINIETELATWGISVTVYNSVDAVVYTSVSSTESKTHEFAIGSLPADEYSIEVQIGSDLYEGVFIL